MINSVKDLKRYLKYEKKLYPNSFMDVLTKDQRTYNWKYVKYLRICEYFYNNRKKSYFNKLLYTIYRRKKNILGSRIGVEIWENSFEEGLVIHHNGSIVINRNCRIGKNCELHGDNCMGNIGEGPLCPILGNDIKVGVGAKIIGNVKLADGIKIGANAVVNKSFDESNITNVGVPAKKVDKEKK